MAATPYRPTTFDDKLLSVEKLQQVSNNIHWLFENSARMRYALSGKAPVTKDAGIKIITGKTPFGTSANDWVNLDVYFGSFFTAGSRPIVTVTVETSGAYLRKFATIHGLGTKGGPEIDYRGFTAHITTHEVKTNKIEAPGWLHWQAIGY